MFTDHEECGNGWAMAFSYMLSHFEFAVSGKFLFLLGKYWKWSRNCNWFISNINWIYWTYNATKGCKLIDIIKWKWILHNDDFPGINFINVNSCCCYVTSVMSDSAWPHRRQPTRLQHPWESPGKSTEWVAISFSSAGKWKVRVKLLSRVQLFTTPWTADHQAPPSMGFSRQEYWSGLLLPSPINVNRHK